MKVEKEQAQPEKEIEIEEPETRTEPEKPTRDDMKAQGWSQKELDEAEKRGMFKEPEKKEEPKEPELPKAPEVTDKEKKEEPKPKNLPDFSLSPEQEKSFNEMFPPGTNVRGLYHRMKNERQTRQRLEAELNEMRVRMEALEKTPKEVQPEVDEDGNPIDPDEKPLTVKQLRELREKEESERQKKEQEIQKQAQLVHEAQKNQEDYARSIYPDFDETVGLAKDVMQNLDTLIPEKWKQEKVIRLVQELQTTAANAHKLGIDDYNAAFIAYEIGNFHPNFGKKPSSDQADIDGKPQDPKKANGSLTPEQMKRIETNTQRRASSASIPGGGGKRTIAVDDIEVSDILKMTASQRQTFKEKHPEKYKQLLRG